MRLALAQINTTVGDLTGNAAAIAARMDQARAGGADIVVFPEMALTGYPPEDLLLKPDFVQAAMRAIDGLLPASRGLTAVVGGVWSEGDLYNAAAVLHDGRLASVYRKQRLPNYGVFDEDRYFRVGRQRLVFARNGLTFGVTVCEDIWYPQGPAHLQAAHGNAELLINCSASPYHRGKGQERERMLAIRAADNTAFVAFCNAVGGQDELVFDGHSLIFDPQGHLIARAGQFEEELLIADIDPRGVLRARLHDPRRRKLRPPSPAGGGDFERVELSGLPFRPCPQPLNPTCAPPLEPVAEVYKALVLGTRDYVRKNGFGQVAVGLSGGVDSSLTAIIAADALGPDNVTGVAMPARYSSPESLQDARLFAANAGLRFVVIPIDAVFQSFLDALAPVFAGRPHDVTEENLQSRVRGTMLMALSNKFGWLILTTGNKSEVGVGYSTLYGDTAGGFAVIKDVPKTLVYRLSRYRNQLAGGDLIPQRVLEKAPTAELRPNQKDSDTLPEYDVLDPILAAYVEQSLSIPEIVRAGFDEAVVRKVIGMADRNEYKRRQSPPGIKITPRAFGKDWRVPITNAFKG